MKRLFLMIMAALLVQGAANADGIWWGYFSTDDAQADNYDGIGTGAQETFEAAIYVPANHPVVGGGTITAIRVWLGDYISSVSSLKVWISKELKNNAQGAEVVKTAAVSGLKVGANVVQLDTPFAVDNQGIYIGYTIGLKAAVYPVMNGGTWVENSFFIRSSQNVTDWSAIDYFGKLALQIQVDGIQLAKNSAVPSDFGTSYVVKGQTVSVPVKVTNMGSEALKSVSYVVTTDGVASEEKTVKNLNVAFNDSKTINIALSSDEDARKYEKTLTITKVNDEANEASSPSATGSLITILDKPVVVPVVEEFTGTWCGWCPVGFDGMEKALGEFGDRVVLIAAHNGDPMEISDYSSIMGTVSGFPSAYVNRDADVYPSAGNLRSAINDALNRVTVADVQATAMWTSDKKVSATITTTTRFVYSDDKASYALAYVLVEDCMTGTSSDWAQANYLSNRQGYESLSFWYNSGSKVTGLEFNHVAVAAWNIQKGITGSVPSSFQAGDELQYSYTANIATKKVIQDKSLLRAVVLLIDRSTGLIVNAAQTAIADFDTAVTLPESAPEETELYDLSGRRLPDGQPTAKGIYIMNGRKVVVK